MRLWQMYAPLSRLNVSESNERPEGGEGRGSLKLNVDPTTLGDGVIGCLSGTGTRSGIHMSCLTMPVNVEFNLRYMTIVNPDKSKQMVA